MSIGQVPVLDLVTGELSSVPQLIEFRLHWWTPTLHEGGHIFKFDAADQIGWFHLLGVSIP